MRRKESTSKKNTAEARVIDATAGPPTRPQSDRATDELVDEQHGPIDAPQYDRHSFRKGTVPRYVRYVRSTGQARISRTKIDEIDETELGEDNVRRAVAEHVEAMAEHYRVSTEATEQEQVRDRSLADLGAKGDLHRRNEPPLVRLLWIFLLPLTAIGFEVPWTYFALQELDESTAATVAMSVVFGAVGILLAELCGVFVRKSKNGDGTRHRGLGLSVAIFVVVLAMLGLFLATIRTAYLATPLHSHGGATLPSALATFHLSRSTVFLGWLAVNLGMWIGVACVAYLHYNPALATLQRAQVALSELRESLVGAATRVIDTAVALQNARTRVANVPLKWNEYREVLRSEGEAREHVYLDSLAHALRDPEATTALEEHDAQLPGTITELRGSPGKKPGSAEDKPA